ncbi:S24 family peptidase [Xanthomonas campestris]|uniref:S24 family peptidase n=1 Tax=Xanthomonas campestris TaxID=339 RepID=UPI000E327CD0|nr:S24 family peptidase [Xanthomonas campestris]RFF46208.1 helix-turn-helix transcriptional regulator [Xanthomonas campestris]
MTSTDPTIVALRRARLRAWIDDRHAGVQASFVAAVAINQGELSGLLNGKKSFGEKKARSLEQAAGMPNGYLDSDSSTTAATSTVLATETPPGYLRLQLFEGAAGMGQGVVNQDFPEVMKVMEVAEWEVRRKLGFLPKPGRIQIITGRGPSMRPKIEDGDIVWIDTSIDYFDGDDYYLISYDGETQIKMLQKRSDGLYVVSANPEFKEWRCDPTDLAVRGKALVHAGFRRF